MDINEAKKVTAEKGNEKKKTLALIAGVVAIFIFGVIVFMPKTKKQEPEVQPAAQAQPQQTAPEFFEEQQGKSTNVPNRNKESLFEKENEPSKEERARILKKVQNQMEIDEDYMHPERPAVKTRSGTRPQVSSAGMSGTPATYQMPYEFRKRLSSDYQGVVGHFRQTAQYKYEMNSSEYNERVQGGQNLAKVEPALRELYPGAATAKQGFGFVINSGTRLTAITDQEVNSDYPGMFTATVVRPYEIKGATLLCNSGSLNRKRIPVNLNKLTYKGKEYSLAGQVQMKYPGIDGDFHNNWYKRLGPELVSTAIGAGFLAWTVKNESGDRIDTRDAIAGPIIQESVSGLQDEITAMGGNVPNTVVVSAGTQFDIMLSETLEMTL